MEKTERKRECRHKKRKEEREKDSGLFGKQKMHELSENEIERLGRENGLIGIHTDSHEGKQ